MSDLDPEDAKLVTLARSARGRTGAPEGAAVRDTDGRTYLAASVDLPSLKLSALQAAGAPPPPPAHPPRAAGRRRRRRLRRGRGAGGRRDRLGRRRGGGGRAGRRP